MSEKTVEPEVQQNLESKVFTISELSKYNGENGAPSYIAINDVVYDISGFHLLNEGKHHGVTAGKDVTGLFVHNASILKRLKVVGNLSK